MEREPIIPAVETFEIALLGFDVSHVSINLVQKIEALKTFFALIF